MFFRSINFALNFKYEMRKKYTRDQAPVVQKVDSAILRLSLYHEDNAIGFPNDYSLDSDLSGG